MYDFTKRYRGILNGFLLLENLTWITLFDRMMSEVPFQRKGIYIYENQPWKELL